MTTDFLIETTAEIVTAYAKRNLVSAERLPDLIRRIHADLSALIVEPAPVPAVPIRGSVQRDTISCLECGTKFQSLRLHLKVNHGMSVDGYRARWQLPPEYPMVSANHAEQRRKAALRHGLGKYPKKGPAG